MALELAKQEASGVHTERVDRFTNDFVAGLVRLQQVVKSGEVPLASRSGISIFFDV
jgi:hypothetical protein